MELTEIYKNLCYLDTRNPYYVFESYLNDDVTPRIDCECENCLTGKNKLALEILRLRDIVETTNPLH